MNRKYLLVTLAIILAIISLWIFKTISDHKKHTMEITLKAKISEQIVIPVKGKVAIVLDDWGYNSSDLALLYDINRPVTVAILPNLRYSEKIAMEARSRGYETLLHLPLESWNNEIPEKGSIYCSMGSEEILGKLKTGLDSVPGVSGVNNHQGSKGTENANLMKIILAEIKKKKLFFLDSVTTGRSICKSVAEEVKLKYARRDVFLDEPSSKLSDKEQILYMQKKLNELSNLAMHKGLAIAIGHDKKITLKVLKEVMPQMEKQGIKFIFVSESMK